MNSHTVNLDPSMTAREDREWKSKINFGERGMDMLCECLHKDPAHRVFTFGPSPVTATPPSISSPSIRRKMKKSRKNPESLCVLLTAYHPQKQYIHW